MSRPSLPAYDAPTQPSRDGLEVPTEPSERVLPLRLGCFEVGRILGRGGMGTVVEAYDPRLDRTIALKMLHGELSERQTRRLLDEARALAQVSHPNVVQIHDLGLIDGRLFIAMELVRGSTLREWQRTRRGWRRCVEVYLQAGQGLVAAHAAGLVHHDFKPSNCIIDDQGRVRVLDFGLVQAEPKPGDEAESRGALGGTPAYMAPEQRRRGPVDARADQYGFCVALYEALHGELPKEVRRPARRVPRRLLRVLERGLAEQPEQRWPSMSALLAELSRLIRPRRWRWLGVGLLGVGLTLTGTALWRQSLSERPCPGQAELLEGVWDDERRAQVEAALRGSSLPYAEYAWTWTEHHLDDYARAWSEAFVDACEATVVRKEQSAAAMDLRMGCLTRRKQALQATVEQLEGADPQVVERAVALTAALPSLQRCDDVEALRAEVPPPEDPRVASRVEDLRRQLADVEVLRVMGRYEQALADVEPLVAEAETLGYAPLRAEAKLRHGQVLQGQGRYADAERELRGAHALALEHWHPLVQAQAVETLTLVVGNQQGRHQEGLVWSETAMALARRQGDDLAVARSLNNRGNVLTSQGEYRQAQEHYERALEMFERTLEPDDPRIASGANRLGTALAQQGELERAQRYFERALAIRERVLGPEHPLVAHPLSNLGHILSGQGDVTTARAYYERALRIREQALGPEHPDLTASLDHMGRVSMEQGDLEAAAGYYERALAISTRTLGPEHPRVAHGLHSLGRLWEERGEYDRARQYFERALAMRRRRLGEDHPTVAITWSALGGVLFELGEYEQSRRHHQRALEIWEPVLAPDDDRLVYPLAGLARASQVEGDLDAARAYAQRALERLVANDASDEDMAELRAIALRRDQPPTEDGARPGAGPRRDP